MPKTKTEVEMDVEDLTDSIKCEVCGSQYDRRAGSSNDCPNCNSPGGRGLQLSATSKEAFAGLSSAAQSALETVSKNVSLLSSRVAALEHEVDALEEKLRG